MMKFLLLVALIVAIVEASHFRYGTVSFTKSVSDPRQVTFKWDLAMRRGFFGAPVTGSSLGAVGSIYGNGGGWSPNFVVTNTDVQNDIIYATATNTISFSGPGSYFVEFQSNARIGNLNNNANGNFYFGATVVLTAPEIARTVPINNSPVSGLLPIVSAPYNSIPYGFQIVASDPENGALSFRLATTTEMQGTHPTGLSCSATGRVALSSVLSQGFWSTQQIITDNVGQKVAVDYLINVVPTLRFCNGPCGSSGTCYTNGDCNSCGSCLDALPAIVMNAIGSSSFPQSNKVAPASGSTLYVTTGNTITVNFVAYDANLPYGSTIVMYTNGVSSFVSVSAQVPCDNAHGCTFNGNYTGPQLLSVTATPPASANGTVSTICVGVTSNGNALTYAQHCVNLAISAPVSICGNGIVEPSEQCDQGTCCDSTCKFATSAVTCRAANGACDVAETCSGSSASCPSDLYATSAVTCRATNGACDVAETCSGLSASCPSDLYATSAVTCRAANGACDVAETCSGSSASCPSDLYATSAVTCRAANGDCDVAETCSGSSSSCPSDLYATSAVTCRAANGACDVAETCSGSSASCPADVYATSAVTCRAANGDCDVAETCSGSSSSCPSDLYATSAVTCRAANGDCDVAETCSGSSASCPMDAFSTSAVTCRAANGDCDVAETCSGSSASCPMDAFSTSAVTCRASTGDCDRAETCSGSSASCPADAYAPSSQVCRASIGGCDAAETCTGSSASCPADVNSNTMVCRPAVGSCDIAETCDGSSSCPIDAVKTTAYCQSATNVCPRISDTNGGNTQYYCSMANRAVYFMCYTQVANGVQYPTYVNMPCPGGTSCQCPYGVDCSQGGTVSPCSV